MSCWLYWLFDRLSCAVLRSIIYFISAILACNASGDLDFISSQSSNSSATQLRFFRNGTLCFWCQLCPDRPYSGGDRVGGQKPGFLIPTRERLTLSQKPGFLSVPSRFLVNSELHPASFYSNHLMMPLTSHIETQFLKHH